MADDLVDELPLSGEYPESIRARLLATANAGIDPSDPAYAQALAGSWANDMFGASALEFDRVYDRMHVEIPAAALPSTATGVALDAWAEVFGTQRKDAVAATGVAQFAGADGTPIPLGTEVSTESPAEGVEPVTFTTTEAAVIAGGIADVPVEAVDDGTIGNVAANSITIIDSAVGTDADPVTISNPLPITGGDDVESDERLQQRLAQRRVSATSSGNQTYYINGTLEEPGVGFVTVYANTPALGDVLIVATDINNNALSTEAVARLQARWDPSGSAAQGLGDAPVGAEVVVETPDMVAVTVAAALAFAAGYSLDGAGGTRALRDTITAALHAYVDALPPGADVVWHRVIAALISVDGVEDASAITVNGVAGDLAITSAQVAALSTITLT